MRQLRSPVLDRVAQDISSRDRDWKLAGRFQSGTPLDVLNPQHGLLLNQFTAAIETTLAGLAIFGEPVVSLPPPTEESTPGKVTLGGYIDAGGPNTHSRFKGKATVNGVANQDFEIEVDDCNEPGSSPGSGPDRLMIKVTGPTQFYANGGPLVGGNIQIHGDPYYIAYKSATGEVDFDRVNAGGLGVTTIGQGTWSKGSGFIT
jgi:hypothetical protein